MAVGTPLAAAVLLMLASLPANIGQPYAFQPPSVSAPPPWSPLLDCNGVGQLAADMGDDLVKTFAATAFPGLQADTNAAILRAKELFLSDYALQGVLANKRSARALRKRLKTRGSSTTLLLSTALVGRAPALVAQLTLRSTVNFTLVNPATGLPVSGGSPSFMDAVEPAPSADLTLLPAPAVIEAIIGTTGAASAGGRRGLLARRGSPLVATALGLANATATVATAAVAVEFKPFNKGVLRLIPQSLLVTHWTAAGSLVANGLNLTSCGPVASPTPSPTPSPSASVPVPSPMPTPSPAAGYEACLPTFGACVDRARGDKRVPYTLSGAVTARTISGWNEFVIPIDPITAPTSAAAVNAYAIEFLINPECQGSSITVGILPANSTESDQQWPHYDSLGSNCTALKAPKLNLTPEQAATAGTALVIRIRPTSNCTSLTQLVAGVAGGDLVYAFASDGYKICPPQRVSLMADA
ncbi:hypothetical protein HYH03_009011 [Edaphochlamys debaryana]|uniref:Pherophorin domain-containing protein n=1 Tax=Edaphochlamys debaryana TaxID=47281 RepID=A0A835XXD8_9CHLO|nr:hypothetical protein HYH03_009011 [Edaphochlamys debaryana]|eukprot:KAG2492857.1 hypothetical protein HYH03_009011 [Edaphochlamys debaryana]